MHRAARLRVEWEAGLLYRNGPSCLYGRVPLVSWDVEAQLPFILRCRSKIAFPWGNSEFRSGPWLRPILSANKLPSTHPDGKFKEVSCKVRIWNRLNQNMSEEKVEDMLINLSAFPTWKSSRNPVLSNALVHFNIILGWRKGLWGLYIFFQYRIFHAPYKNVTGLVQKYFYWHLNW